MNSLLCALTMWKNNTVQIEKNGVERMREESTKDKYKSYEVYSTV